jgi:tetratricopeptide (TPR) repeat protein
MEIKLLDEKTQTEIDEIINGAWDNSNENEEEYVEILLKAWDLYPNPKEQWSETYNLAKYIFHGYMDISNFKEAKKWLEKMTEVNNAYVAWNENSGYTEELNFEAGKYYFETGNYEEAYTSFREAVRASGGHNHFRYFDGEDKKYLEFYKKEKRIQDNK